MKSLYNIQKAFVSCLTLLFVISLPYEGFGQGTDVFQIQLTGVIDFSGYTAFIEGQDMTLIPDREGVLYDVKRNSPYLSLPDGSYKLRVIHSTSPTSTESSLYDFLVDKERVSVIFIRVTIRKGSTASEYLEDIVVKGQKTNLSPSTATRQYLDAGLARLTPGTGGEILNAVKNYPGIGGSHKAIIIRGAESSDVLYMFNQVPILSPYHSFSFYSIFPLNIVNHLEFYPGTFPIQYGESQGSLIEIFPKTLKNNVAKPSFNLNFNPVSTDGSLYFPIRNMFAVAASGRISYYNQGILFIMNEVIDAIPLAPSSPNFNISFRDYFVAMEFQPNELHHFYIWHSATEDAFDYDSLFRTPLIEEIPNITTSQYIPKGVVGTNIHTNERKIDESWYTYAITYDLSLESLNHKTTLSLVQKQDTGTYTSERKVEIESAFEDLFDFTNQTFVDLYELSVDQWNFKNETYMNLLGELMTLGAGLDLTFLNNDLNITNADLKSVINQSNVQTTQASVFVNAEFYLLRFFTVNTGLRIIDLISLDDSIAFDPRANLIIDLNESTSLHLSLGKYSDYQEDYYVNNTFESIFRSSLLPVLNVTQDAAIKPYSWQYGTGIKGALYEQAFTLDAYYRDLYHQRMYVTLDSDHLNTLENVGYVYHGRGRAYGLEVTLQNDVVERIAYTVGYAYSISEREIFSIPKINETEALQELDEAVSNDTLSNEDNPYASLSNLNYQDLDRIMRPFIESITHHINLTLAWNMTKRIRWSASYKGASGRPYTPHVIVRPGDHTLGFLSKPYTEPEAYNSGRLRFTHSLSLRFDYISRYFTFYVDVLNIDTLFARRIITYNPNQATDQSSLLSNKDLTVDKGAVVNTFSLVAPLLGFEIKF